MVSDIYVNANEHENKNAKRNPKIYQKIKKK